MKEYEIELSCGFRSMNKQHSNISMWIHYGLIGHFSWIFKLSIYFSPGSKKRGKQIMFFGITSHQTLRKNGKKHFFDFSPLV